MEFTFDISQFMLRLLGAFYAFAGYIAGRAALTSRVLDQAIAALARRRPIPARRANRCGCCAVRWSFSRAAQP